MITMEASTKGQLLFVVPERQMFLIPRRLMGKKDRHLHELELFVAGVGYNSVKCELKVYKISRDGSRDQVDDQ
jgi:hypothetical protein